jgi:hypothetical protein
MEELQGPLLPAGDDGLAAGQARDTLFNLYTNPREDQDKQITDSWVIGPVLKMVDEFEASTKKHPLIAMGTPDPYVPPN